MRPLRSLAFVSGHVSRRAARSFVGAALACTCIAATSLAYGGELTVAGEAQPAAPQPSIATTFPGTPAPSPDRAAPPAPEKERKGVDLGGTMYLFTGTAIDDLKQGAFMVRPALELYVALGLGDVSLELGGTVLAVEGSLSSVRSSVSIPALMAVTVKDDDWNVGVAGGVSLASDNSYGDVVDDEVSLPSPRAELRGGYRIEKLAELTGIVGYERRLYENRENENRLFFGLSFGIGAAGKQDQ